MRMRTQALHPDVLLVVAFLGCWVLREAVMPADIVRWAGEGTLPFLALPSQSAELLAEARGAGRDLPPALLQLTGW